MLHDRLFCSEFIELRNLQASAYGGPLSEGTKQPQIIS
jgi:hypothetical protein